MNKNEKTKQLFEKINKRDSNSVHQYAMKVSSEIISGNFKREYVYVQTSLKEKEKAQ